MANTIVQLHSLPSLGAMTLRLYPRGGGAIVNGGSGDSLTESGDTPGLYLATVTEALSGIYAARVYSGSDMLGSFLVDLRDTTSAYDLADPSIASGVGALALDEIEAVAGGGGGGGDTVILNVVPSVIGVGDVRSDTITAYLSAAGNVTVLAVDSEGTEITLPDDVTFCVETRPGRADLFTMTPDTVDNEAAVEWTAADVPTVGEYYYSLRDTSTGRVYAEGVFRVKYAALAD